MSGKINDIRQDVQNALKLWDASQLDGMGFILGTRGNWESERAKILSDICEDVGLSMGELIWNEARCLSMLYQAIISSDKHSQPEKVFMLESISCDFSSVGPFIDAKAA